MLDVAAATEQTGKTRGADLLDGTVNLPLIEAVRIDPSLAELDLRAIDTPRRAAEICDRIVATGAPEIVLDEARRLVAEAKDLLRDAVGTAERAMFASIADQAVARSK